MKMRIMYWYHNLSDEAKKVAARENEGTLLTQWAYNKDGTRFEISTEVKAYNEADEIHEEDLEAAAEYFDRLKESQ